MLILLDQDGVLADCEKRMLEIAHERWPDFNPPAQHERSSFYLEADMPQYDFRSILHEEGFFASLEVMPGAHAGVEAILEDGHDIRVCTSPVESSYCAKEKMDWLAEHFPQLREGAIISKDKTIIRGDILIDDKPDITGLMQPEWLHVPYYYGLPIHDGTFTWQNMHPLWQAMHFKLAGVV